MDKTTQLYQKIITIQNSVSKYYGIHLERMLSPSRERVYALARQISMVLCHEYVGDEASLKYIGRAHNRDHATVLHSIKTIQNQSPYDESIAKALEVLHDELDQVLGTQPIKNLDALERKIRVLLRYRRVLKNNIKNQRSRLNSKIKRENGEIRD